MDLSNDKKNELKLIFLNATSDYINTVYGSIDNNYLEADYNRLIQESGFIKKK